MGVWPATFPAAISRTGGIVKAIAGTPTAIVSKKKLKLTLKLVTKPLSGSGRR